MARAWISWGAMMVVLLLAAAAADAAALGLGSKVKPFTLADQNGKQHRVDETVRVIIFTPDMGAGDVVKEALGGNGRKLLDTHRAVYLADLSAMPGFVRNLLALPRLKERPYPMLLDTEGDVSRALPSRADHATLIFLDKLQITAVEYFNNPATIVPALAAPKRFAAH